MDELFNAECIARKINVRPPTCFCTVVEDQRLDFKVYNLASEFPIQEVRFLRRCELVTRI